MSCEQDFGLVKPGNSSIVNWGYQDNFKPVNLFFFYEKILNAEKTSKHKTSDFHSHRSFYAQKTVAFVVFLFCWLMFACECFFTRRIKKKKNRLGIILIASIHYTAEKNLVVFEQVKKLI